MAKRGDTGGGGAHQDGVLDYIFSSSEMLHAAIWSFKIKNELFTQELKKLVKELLEELKYIFICYHTRYVTPSFWRYLVFGANFHVLTSVVLVLSKRLHRPT